MSEVMHQDIPVGYTQFPRLSPKERDVSDVAAISWDTDGVCIPLDALVLSWATLLWSFTGEEYPTFILDGKPVQADLSSWSFKPIKPEDLLQDGGGCSGIFTNSDSKCDESLLIALTYDLDDGTGYIRSTLGISSSYLTQIGYQLKHCIRYQLERAWPQITIPAEDALTLSILNPNPQFLRGAQFLHHLLSKKGKNLTAIEFLHDDGARDKLSYESLDRLSTRFALRLVAALESSSEKQQPNNVIPILIPQSTNLYIALLAILKAGAAFCPLNLDAPLERITFILNDVAASVVVTTKSLAGKFKGAGQNITIIYIDDDVEETKEVEHCSFKPRELSPDNLAYVMYTSGSTGLPKGVGVSHRAATQSLLAHDGLIPSFTRFLQFAATTFDVSVFEIFFPLFRGATLVGCERGMMLNDLPGIMRKLEVDASELTPTVATELLRNRQAVPSLRVLLTIGEMLTRHVVQEFGISPRNDGLLHGMYGPTEAAIHCTIARNFNAESKIGIIGSPLPTVSAYIVAVGPSKFQLDDELGVLPLGHIGELAVGGHQLASFYINRPEENAKAFVDTSRYGRVYRTGDRARLLPSGDIEMLGRISGGQVKLRGQRLELGEIEHVVCKADGIRNAVASVVNDILIVFVLADNDDYSLEIIRQVCRRWLPKFMVPGDFIFLAELPRLPSGKIDKKDLERNYVLQKRGGSNDIRKFTDASENKIATCVGETLSTSISSSTSLSAAGLDSLTAIRLSARLRAIGVEVDVAHILEADTVHEIWLATKRGASLRTDSHSVSEVSENDWNAISQAGLNQLRANGWISEAADVIPCSPTQVSMLSESVKNPEAYFNRIELEFNEAIEESQIKNAFCTVAQHNEILRSSFIEIDFGGYSYAQVIWKSLPDSRVSSLLERPPEGLNEEDNGFRHPFRIQLNNSRGTVKAVVHIHHALYDGWSWELILNDVQEILSDRPLKPRPQYRMLTEFYQRHTKSEYLDSLGDYWQDQLQDISPTFWPNFNDRSDIPSNIATSRRPLDISLSTVDSVSRDLRVGRPAFFQAAFGYILSAYAGSHDIVFGSVSSGRTLSVEGIEDIIGPCINTLPMRLNIGNSRNVRDLLAVVHTLNRGFIKYGALPLGDIKKASGVDPTSPLFDSLFIWQETLSSSNEPPQLVSEINAAEFLEFTMTLEIELSGDKLTAKATYPESVLPQNQVDILLDQIEQVASLFMRFPDLLLADINSRLTDSVLSIENENFKEQKELPGLANGVETFAKEDPERIAIEFLRTLDPQTEDTKIDKLTYRQLNNRANKVAHHILKLGVGETALVGILLEKSVDFYVSVLAVIKAGAGYVPIIPDAPVDFVWGVLNEARCGICITSSSLPPLLGASHSLRIVNIDLDEFSSFPEHNTVEDPQNNQGTYAAFTPGKLEEPEGIIVTRHGVQSNIKALSDTCPKSQASKWLFVCPHVFSGSVSVIFFSWNSGMTLCSAADDILFRDIEQAIRTMGATHLNLVPTAASLVNPNNVPNVKFLLTSGEELTPKVFKDWAGKGLYQGYEPSGISNICTLTAKLESAHFMRNIGKPLSNTSVFVVSSSEPFSLAPKGAIGELCFGGADVCHAYTNDTELTRKKFISHPKYGRLYKSGDLGRLLPDGSLVCAGHHDDQPKPHSQHIDLGEISRCLLKSTEVKDCITMIIKDDHSERQWLVSFWVSNRKTNNAEDLGYSRKTIISLFDEISVALPDSMIPSYLLPIHSIPMKGSWKTDQRMLIKDFRQRTSADLQLYSRAYETREINKQFSEVEEIITRVLANITHVSTSDIQRNTSFFSLGLNSISAITFARRLRREGLDQVDISSIMRHSSIGRLSNLISRTAAKHISTSESNIKLESVFDNKFVERKKRHAREAGKTIQRIMPCTPLQEAMLSQKASSYHSAYYNHLTFEIIGDVDKLHSAWSTAQARHDILRTCFFTTENARYAFAQAVLEGIELPWGLIKASAEDIEARVESKKAEMSISENNYDIPYSLSLFTSNATERSLLLLSIHHALYDAEAMSELLQDVEKIYFGQPLPEVVSFDAFLQKMVSTDQEESSRFWDTYLAGNPTTSLVTSIWGSKHQNTPKEYQREQLIPDFSLSWVEMECRRMSTTLLGLFQMAWAKLLTVYTGQPDVCFGNVFSCRTLDLEGAERIVGPCFNTLPIRAQFSENTTNFDILKDLQKCNADIMSHQLSSLRRIQRRSTTNNAHLFDSLVLLQNSPRSLNDSLWRLVRDEGDMDFPLVCEIIPEQRVDQIQIYLHFDASHVPAKDIRVLMENYAHLIKQILQFPSARAMDSNALENQTLETAISEKKVPDTIYNSNRIPNGISQTPEWSHEELEVVGVLVALSGVDPTHIDPETTIFQLGLDSINAVQIAARLRESGFTVSSGDVLEAASVRELASFLQSPGQLHSSQPESFDFQSFQQKYWSSLHDPLDVPESAVESLRPCTPVQAGILAMFLHSGGDMYFNHVVYKIPLHVQPESLKNAWTTVSEQHEMLRTGFIQIQDEQCPFGMVTYRKGTFKLSWNESSCILGNTDLLSRERAKLSKQVLANIHRPPWHLTLQNCGSFRALQFSALHVMFDAQALELIISDVLQAYKGGKLPDPVSVSTVLDPIISSGLRQVDESKEFWECLGKEFRVTKFPDLSPVHMQGDFEVLTKSCSMPANCIDEGCRRAGITLTAAGQLSWARILAEYTGAADITYGLVLSGRHFSEEANNVVFPCLTTVPAPCNVEGSNSQVLKRIMRTNASLAKHQFASLSRIHRWTNSDRGLFDTIFVHQKLSSSPANKGWEVLDEEAKVEYPISVELIPRGSTLDFVLTFRTDVLPRKQAELLLEQLDSIFIDSIYSPESDSADFSMVNSNLLSITPASEAKIQSPIVLLHQFVEAQAARNPSKTALEFVLDVSEKGITKKTWTYQQLDEESNRYARMLQGLGASPGGLVGICFDKCPEAYFSIFAILKAGCAYVALDPTAPISRKRFIVEDSGCKIILCTSTHNEELKDLPETILIAADTPKILDEYPPSPPSLSRPIRPDDTSYCLYTSGTTGTPKGCEITHGNAVQAMLAFQRIFDGHWDEHSRWLQFASFHFDVSVLEQYWSWGVGICVTSCPRDVLFSDLAGVIHQLEITHIDLTPSLARLITPREVPSLCRGVFITGGEKLKQEILDVWGESQVVYNFYGPTEATIGCTVLPRMSKNGKPSNIGTQFDNVGSFVLKPQSDAPVMRGCIGELCVSGPLVGRGYLNRPELTEEKFQQLGRYGERVYRTGDLVRILHDGSFSFLGRIDDQVKLRGQRLEIGEINEVVRLSTATIRDVSTQVLMHPKQSKEQLVSFVVSSQFSGDLSSEEVWSSDDARLLVSQVRTTCSTRLPGYMVPTHIIPMSAFPLSPNNKIDSRKLKDMYDGLPLETLKSLSSTNSYSSGERTATMEAIASHLSKFSGCSAGGIGPTSSIFALGLDSISVIAFARALRKAGFDSAEPSLIMKNPQLSQMSAALEFNNKDGISMRRIHQEAKQNIAAFAHSHLLSVSRDLGTPLESIERVAPCTPLQEGMIYRALESKGQLYYSSFCFELGTSKDIPRLKASWASVQSSVEILRTRFTLTADGYAQVVVKSDSFPWFDYTASNDVEVEEIINDYSRRWGNRTPKFGQGLWSVGVIRSSEKVVMLLNLFHALFDGNSLPLLLGRVGLAYTGTTEVSRAPSFLEALPFGPLSKHPKAEHFWLDHLKGLKHRSIPINSSLRDQGPTSSELDIPGLSDLEIVRRRLNVTEQSILHACWLLTSKKYFGFIPNMGVIVSGRTLDVEDAENIIGPMFNTIPCHIQLHGLTTVSDLIRKCHSYYASTLPFQHTPLRDITKWVGRSPDEPLFDSLFAFQRDNEDSIQATEQLWSSETSHAEPDYPLAFEARRRREGFFTVSIAAQPAVMGSETGGMILSHFRDTLLKIVEDPDQDLPTADESGQYPKGQVNHNHENGYVVSHEQRTALPTSFEWTQDAERIREEISTLSGVDKSSIHESSSILELGLDSIDAIKLSSRLNKAGIGLSVSAIMQYRTVEKMMDEIVTSQQHKADSDKESIDQLEKEIRGSLEKERLELSGIDRVLPATPLQEAMIAEMIASGYSRYFNHEILELDEDTDVDMLKHAWNAVIEAHPILRTSFIEVSDPSLPFSYAQAIHSPRQAEWKVSHAEESVIDTSIVNEEKELQAKDDHAAQKPPLRLRLIIDCKRTFLLLSISHALYDGWSLSLLHHDVAGCYAGKSCGRPSYQAILENILNSSGTNAVDFWKGFLANVQPASFPKQPQSRQDSIEVHRKDTKAAICLTDINEFCKKQGVTIQALGLTCWALVLAGYLGKLDVVFGVVLSGRSVENGDQIMFPTMNTVAMRAILHGSRSQMLKYVQETIGNISEYQHFPLRKAKSEAGIGGQALFDTLFIYQKTSDKGIQPEKPLYTPVGGSSDLEYPVCVEMEGVDDSLIWRLACKDSIIGTSDTTQLVELIQEVLQAIIYQPNEPTVEFMDNGAFICGNPVYQEAGNGGKESPQGKPTATADTVWSTQEISIRQVLSAVSKIPETEITKNTSLFHLGLDSISAIKVSSLLKKQSITLLVSDMLRAGTISNMARVLSSDPVGSKPTDIGSVLKGLLEGIDTAHLLRTHSIPPHNVEKLMPTTSGQTYLLGMSSVVDEHVFFPDFCYRVNGEINPEQLEEAWRQLVISLPILRTAFVPTGQRELPFIQAVFKEVQSPIVWHNESKEGFSWHRSRPGISSVPATILAHQMPGQLIIKLQIHHAMYDAVSLPKMIETLTKLCNDPSWQVDSKVDISELVCFNSINSPIEQRKRFWEDYLSGVHKKIVPPRSNFPRPDTIRCYRPGLVGHVGKIEDQARRHGLSVQSLFLAAYARIHAQLIPCPSGQVTPESIVIGVYLANRSHSLEGLPDLIAPSLNIIPLRIRNPLGAPILDLARRIQTDLHEIGRVENSCVSLLEIADWTGIKLDTFANFLKLPDSEQELQLEQEQELELDATQCQDKSITFVPLEASEVEKYTRENNAETIVSRHSSHEMDLGRDKGGEEIARSHTHALPALTQSGSSLYDDIFKPSIDVEVAIRDNRLDVGIFGPGDRIDESTAADILDALRLEIENLLLL